MRTSISTTIAVIGAGYAGVLAANRVAASLTARERDTVRVVMINQSGDFIDRIRLHEVAAGSRDTACTPLRDMLHESIELLVGSVLHIDPELRLLDVATTTSSFLEYYDTLIYAVGSNAALGAPGVEESAHLISNLDGANAARSAIARGPADQRVVVVGGGATGVETAAEIAEQYPMARVTLISSGDLLGHWRRPERASVTKTLVGLGVQIEEQVRVSQVLPGRVELSDGRTVPSDVTIWAASFGVPDLARTSGLAVDALGRLRVDETLGSLEFPEIIGAGDAVRPPDSVGAHLRMGCAIAMPIGAHAADNVLARLRGLPVKPLSVGFGAQCISLGRRAGFIQFVTADDKPRPFHISGRAGALVKEAVCTYIAKGSPRREGIHPNTLWWAPAGPSRDQLEKAAAQ